MVIHSLCIHGHFYQPPREDPLTGAIPREVGAAPYKNWNERIHAECYRPNAELRNFEHISFNVGPTLYDWMESHDPETCQRIAQQDRANIDRYGVGNAMAQAYNHTILPLASQADKITQVAWGIADFQYRFGRKPQGMWLPETSADIETLSVLADQGIAFTILAPWQAESDTLDSNEPYLAFLPGGRSITVFFYNSELSSRVSFDPGATINADHFAHYEVSSRFRPDKTQRGEPQLLLIASDGELYGHHKEFRDRFLARLVDGAATQVGITSTFPALWLEHHPPRRTIGIRDKTSWSCHHGVMRWMGECSCTPGDGRWKYYLRHALDRLAVSLDQLYFENVSRYIPDPWALRNRYIHVMLGQVSARDLINEMAGYSLPVETIRQIHQLLEAQRERQRMFTSCGWYFEDFSRIEPKNNVAYAAQAVHLAHQACGVNLVPQVVADLKRVIGHRAAIRGDMVFNKHLQRASSIPGIKE